jgi:CHAT domain-containing protein
VWEPLKKELRGIKNVYFSPVGDLHKIAIEYAKDGEKYIFEERNLYRLSSTRQLAVQKSQNQYQKSAIFGGFEFNASEDLLDIDTNTCVTKDIVMNNSINVDSLNIRGAVGNKKGVKDLPGTLIEAQKISETLELTNIKTSLITGINGTETRFKKLTGQNNDIIHIATHGFYWEGEFRNAAKSDSSVIPYTEDKALNYSGLLFSGVNNMFRNGLPKLDGVDDGILTATEIS